MPERPVLAPVLLVDDSPDDIFFIRRLLTRAGVANPIATFLDGAAALAYLRNMVESPEGAGPCPEVMFLDLKMPNIHGFVLLKWLRRQPAFDAMKIVVLSGSDEPKDRLRSEKLGADKYLVKFPDSSVIAQVVASGRAQVAGASG
jgi:CheY-like chemotaxis protein